MPGTIAKQSQPAPAASPRRKVLVVDDDPITLQVIRDRLEPAGFEVHVRDCALGTSAWIIFEKPDFVLLDIGMPALSGAVLADFLNKKCTAQSVGVILHSSLEPAKLEALARSVGALGAIAKTSDATLFLTQFERLVGGIRPE
jgi:CheY-like chemotaxis protein